MLGILLGPHSLACYSPNEAVLLQGQMIHTTAREGDSRDWDAVGLAYSDAGIKSGECGSR